MRQQIIGRNSDRDKPREFKPMTQHISTFNESVVSMRPNIIAARRRLRTIQTGAGLVSRRMLFTNKGFKAKSTSICHLYLTTCQPGTIDIFSNAAVVQLTFNWSNLISFELQLLLKKMSYPIDKPPDAVLSNHRRSIFWFFVICNIDSA